MSTMTTSAAPLRAPTRWGMQPGDPLPGGRRVLRLLGGGERFEAYATWDDRLHAPVVAKVLRPHLVDDARALAAIRREANALGALQHPDLVRCFGAVLDGPRPHLVLEYLDGPRLSTLIRRFGPLSPEQLVLLGRRLASVMAYLAAERWVHLDLKPRNIVMTATPTVIDLSVARPIEDARGRTGIGTDAYMSPEQCDPERAGEIGAASDVWGIGATLHEAVTGRQAFVRAPGEPPHPQLRTPPPPPPARPPAPLAEVVVQCLADRPEARPAAAALVEALEPLADWASRSARRLR